MNQSLYFLERKEVLSSFKGTEVDHKHIDKTWIEHVTGTYKDYFKLEHKYFKLKDIDNYDDKKWILCIPITGMPIVRDISFWDLLPVQVKNKLNNDIGSIFLLFHMEGFADQFFDELYKNNTNVPWRRITYITSCLNAKDVYDAWCKRNNITEKMNIMSVNAWEGIKHYQDLNNIKIKDPRFFKNRNKKYLNLNRRVRPHRPFFVSLLEEEKQLHFGYVSLFLNDDLSLGRGTLDNVLHTWKDFKCNNVFGQELRSKALNGFKKLKDKLPLIVDTANAEPECNTVKIISDYYYNSYYSLVSETYYSTSLYTKNPCFGYEDGIFFSEKIYKPVVHLQPFVLIGRPHSLKYFKNLGYKTFYPFINEEYDTFECPFERANAIMKEVKRLNAIPNHKWDDMIVQMYPILKHNFDRCSINLEETIYKTDLYKLKDWADS